MVGPGPFARIRRAKGSWFWRQFDTNNNVDVGTAMGAGSVSANKLD